MPVATQEHRAAEQAGFRSAGLPSPPRAGTFILPLGLVDEEERCHREAELFPLSGQEQRMLASFSSSTPVSLITTELLCRCLVRLGSLPVVDRCVVRSLLAGDREFLLLKLYQMTFGNNLLALLSCPSKECGESLEFPLVLEECVIEAPPVGSRIFTLSTSAGGKRSLRFRLPTGADQEMLSGQGEIDPEVLRQRLLAACCAENDSAAVEGLSHEECAFLEEQMGRLAPQLEVEVEAACPDCGAGFSTRIDVPYLVLAEMNINEAELDWEVHYLAWHYHWPETEILALTPGRRRRYISLVQRELEGSGES